MNIRNALFAAALAAISAGSFAQDWRHDGALTQIDQRQARQEERIQRGIQSGRLSGREAARLQREQQAIRRTERTFRSDGIVTPNERARLVAMLDRADANIRRDMRDDHPRR